MSYSYYLISKWTKGEEVEKSIRKTNNENNQEKQSINKTEMFDNNINNNNNNSETGFTRQANKRDSFNEMLSHRDLHTQVGQNPFLAGEHYLQHLNVQENYLRPQNTNVIEPKNNS
jgi:hypothetical protein